MGSEMCIRDSFRRMWEPKHTGTSFCLRFAGSFEIGTKTILATEGIGGIASFTQRLTMLQVDACAFAIAKLLCHDVCHEAAHTQLMIAPLPAQENGRLATQLILEDEHPCVLFRISGSWDPSITSLVIACVLLRVFCVSVHMAVSVAFLPLTDPVVQSVVPFLTIYQRWVLSCNVPTALPTERLFSLLLPPLQHLLGMEQLNISCKTFLRDASESPDGSSSSATGFPTPTATNVAPSAPSAPSAPVTPPWKQGQTAWARQTTSWTQAEWDAWNTWKASDRSGWSEPASSSTRRWRER